MKLIYGENMGYFILYYLYLDIYIGIGESWFNNIKYKNIKNIIWI